MTILLADIGGTHVRFSFLNNGKLSSVVYQDCDQFPTAYHLLDSIIASSPLKISSMFLAVAGPVQNGKVQWTNRPSWKLSEAEIKKRYRIKKACLFNDVYAQAMGLKVSPKKEILLMNVGTGFGSCFVKKSQIFPCEFGLVLGENNLKKETYLSASGIVRLYHEFGGDKKIHSARKIDDLRLKKDKIAQKTYERFYSLWGRTGANIATGLVLKDVVYLWGGLAPKNDKDMAVFLKAFYHPSYPVFTKKIKCKVVKEESLTIKGLKNLSEA